MMTTEAFCARLETALSRMAPEERQEIIRYYSEFLEEASEEERIALGTPEELATRVLQENGIPTAAPTTTEPIPQPKDHHTSHLVISICTFPIWLPLWASWYVILLSALICLACIPISFGASLLGMLFYGILILFQDVPIALFGIGVGLICGGITILLWKPIWIACRSVVKFAIYTTKLFWHLLIPERVQK